MFSDMGLGGTKSNVNNELIAIKSPSVLLEVGKQLKLNVDYAVDGRFHRNVLYGNDLLSPCSSSPSAKNTMVR